MLSKIPNAEIAQPLLRGLETPEPDQLPDNRCPVKACSSLFTVSEIP